jgi:protein-S-isoprenylcysteine O-methyltransferase Ste14
MMWLASKVTPDLSIALPFRLLAAVVFALAGVGLIVAARIMLDRAHTTWHPTEPERAANLVSAGVFGFSRNPTYLGMLIVLIGWAIALANPVALAISAIFALWMSRFQIQPEERVLEKLFGQEYRDYASEVRRWF